MPGRVIYVVRSWPRLSQTFIVNEVLALERRGISLEIHAMAASQETVVQSQVSAVRAPIAYLDAAWTRRTALFDHVSAATASPRRYLTAVAYALRHPGLSAGYATVSTLRCLRYAVRIAARMRALRAQGEPVTHVHAHFAHDPALVALLTHMLTGAPYSITGHARDLYQIPGRNLAVRAASASTVVTCCEANAGYLRDVLPARDVARVRVIRHGVDVQRFSPVPRQRGGGPARVVSVGRLVEKKGFPDLLRACALVAAEGHQFTLAIYGDGPMRGELEQLVSALHLDDVVQLAGERDGDDVLTALRAADVFALAPFVTDDGDRDGVPNVIIEAMACGLPVVATDVGGIAEAVDHAVTGLLAQAHDVHGLAAHLAALLTDARLRRRLGAAGRQLVEEGFDVDSAAAELAQLFGQEAVRTCS